jgi:hypothetical protein
MSGPYRSERELRRDFEQRRAGIFGALLDLLVQGVRQLPTTHLARLPRMADFALWAVSAEQGLGFPAGTFLKAYDRNRKDANGLALEASPVFLPMITLTDEEIKWEGTASDLLRELGLRSSEEITRTRAWPKSARTLSGILRRLAPNFRAIGISVSFQPRESGTGRRLIVVEKDPVTSSQSSQRQTPNTVANTSIQDDLDGRDGRDEDSSPDSVLSPSVQGVEEYL